MKIKENYDTEEKKFSCTLFSNGDILGTIKSVSDNKFPLSNNIPIKVMKSLILVYSETLTNIYNEFLINDKFPNTIKEQVLPQFLKKGIIMKRKIVVQ